MVYDGCIYLLLLTAWFVAVGSGTRLRRDWGQEPPNIYRRRQWPRSPGTALYHGDIKIGSVHLAHPTASDGSVFCRAYTSCKLRCKLNVNIGIIDRYSRSPHDHDP